MPIFIAAADVDPSVSQLRGPIIEEFSSPLQLLHQLEASGASHRRCQFRKLSLAYVEMASKASV